jgi:hypothetical protein
VKQNALGNLNPRLPPIWGEKKSEGRGIERKEKKREKY